MTTNSQPLSHSEENEDKATRTAEDVYWEFVANVGEEVCAHAVVN
jgi:hypothetical protein